MNKDEFLEKLNDEIEVIKNAPILFVSGVFVVAVVIQLLFSFLNLDEVTALNERIREKNAIIIDQNERINNLLDQIRGTRNN